LCISVILLRNSLRVFLESFAAQTRNGVDGQPSDYLVHLPALQGQQIHGTRFDELLKICPEYCHPRTSSLLGSYNYSSTFCSFVCVLTQQYVSQRMCANTNYRTDLKARAL
jgi:hypothetical protein